MIPLSLIILALALFAIAVGVGAMIERAKNECVESLKRKTYLLYTFSSQMLCENCMAVFTEIDALPDVDTLESAIAHKETAAILRVQQRRTNVILPKGSVAYLAQLQGGRLPSGCTELPDGFSFKYWRIEIR